jgi:hypothetical protein
MHFIRPCKEEIGNYLGECGEVFIREHFDKRDALIPGRCARMYSTYTSDTYGASFGFVSGVTVVRD